MQVRSIIERIIVEVADEQKKNIPPLRDDLQLFETGLDSLCLAVIVARMEGELGIDPFNYDVDTVFPTTIGQFVKFYEAALH